MGGGGSGVRKRKSHRNGVSRCSRFSCGAHQHTHAQQGCNAPGSAPPRPSAASRPWCAPRACRPRQRPCPCAPEAAEQRRRVSTQTRSGIGLRHKARGITRLFLLPLALLAHATLLLHGRRRVSARGRRVTRKQETRARAPPFLAACPPSWPRGAWRGRPAPRHTPRADRARFRSAGVDFGHRFFGCAVRAEKPVLRRAPSGLRVLAVRAHRVQLARGRPRTQRRSGGRCLRGFPRSETSLSAPPLARGSARQSLWLVQQMTPSLGQRRRSFRSARPGFACAGVTSATLGAVASFKVCGL